jgi:alpha-L-rhamnosidase
MFKNFLICLLLIGAASTAAAVVTVENLRCEYLHNPLGLDVAKPRLTWILKSDQRNEAQTAYRVIVASSPALLAKDQGDLWDSGKVSSDESAHVEYGGSSLSSRQACWWKVCVWDHGNTLSAWSAPAQWEMGLLQPEDWQAKWISAPPTASPAKGGNDDSAVTITHAFYEASDGGASKEVTDVVSGMLSNNQLNVKVSNDAFGGDPAYGHPKQLRVDYTQDGKAHEVTANEGTTLTVPWDGKTLPYLRKDFSLTQPIAKARLYVTALGLYEIHLNGQRIGNHLFAPDWTDYNKRVRYQVYDVTSLVKSGDNTLGALVGNGWYSGHIGNGGFQAWGKIPALFAQLEVTAADGTVNRIVTDASWKIHASPILSSDFMLGENYDAQMEIAGWDKPGLDTGDWSAASERTEATRALNGQVDEPVVQTGEIHPKSKKEIKPGRWIFDLGQNMVGYVRLKVSASPGTVVTLRHAEMLNSDGTIYTANYRGAPSIDTYACKGEGVETWQPHFTFHGFRYVELSGLPQAPDDDTVTGVVIGSDIPLTGKFLCSNPDVNQLQSNIQWGMRGNYFAVPTDCPQRDERMGWMGDAEIFVQTATYNGDIAAFFTKWVMDIDDAQHEDGAFTDVSPAPGTESGGGTPAWGDAGVICPWTIYLMYGDKRILEQHLPAMARWVDWSQAHSTNLIRDRDRGGDYGDWLSQSEDTPKDLIGTAFFAYSASLVSKAYQVTGNQDQADKYQHLFEQIKAAFNQHYVTADGRIANGSQTDYGLALDFDLLSDDNRVKAGQYLAEDVAHHKNHLTTGFVGVSHLLPSLCAENQLDTAYSVFQQDTFPSWLFSVKQGATTIWEHWDGWTPEHGFQNPGMNSFNHYSLGSCGVWMFDTVAGIGVDPARPGFKHIVICPRPGGGLTSAEGSVDSIYGKIATKWTLESGSFSLEVNIPANTTATVELPTTNPSSVREDRLAVTANKNANGAAQYDIGSGTYTFTCEVPQTNSPN